MGTCMSHLGHTVCLQSLVTTPVQTASEAPTFVRWHLDDPQRGKLHEEADFPLFV